MKPKDLNYNQTASTFGILQLFFPHAINNKHKQGLQHMASVMLDIHC